MLPVLAAGLWRSGLLQQELWSRTLALQAGVLLGGAAIVTYAAICLVPPRIRGWPTLIAAALAFTAAANGVGPTLATLLIGLVCLVAGRAILLAVTPTPFGAMLTAATGLAALLLFLTGVVAARLPFLPIALLIPVAAAATLVASPTIRRQLYGGLLPGLQSEPWTPLRTIAAGLILGTWLFYAANAALPERFYDPLTMHLMIPTQALTFGHWTPDPLRYALAFFPIAVDDLFALAMALGGDGAPALVNLLAMAGILLLVHEIVRPMGGALVAEVTVLLVLSLPIALLCSTTAMVENVLALQMIAALAALLHLRANPPAALAVLVLLLPAMAATKLHGLVAGLPCALLALPALRALPRPTGRRLLALAAPAALLGAAPYANAWLRTGNPVYPLLNNLFHSPFWPPVAFEDLRWQGHLSWRLLYRMTFDSRTYLESDNGAMGVALLLLLIPGLVATALVPRRTPVIALAIGGFYMVVVAAKFQYIRYLWPAFPLLLIPAAHAIAILGPRFRPIGLATAGLAAALGMFLLPSAAWVLKAADLRAAWDPAARHAMLATQAPTRLAVDAINALGPAKPRVLFGAEPYGAFLRGTPIYAAWSNRPFNAALHAATTPDAVAATIATQAFDYIIVPEASTDPIEQKIFAYALTHATRLPLQAGTALWRLR